MGDAEVRQINVLGEPLECCCTAPMTGFFRDGYCHTGPMDVGRHTVCTKVTEEFLAFSAQAGNDLVTARPEVDFPGLKSGDGWCLCASRWAEAERAGCAPKVYLQRTHIRTLDVVPLALLKTYALDLI